MLPAPAPLPAAAPAPLAPVPVAQPPVLARRQPAGFPWALVVVPAVAVLALGALAIYWLTRSYPYGYLYNDRDRVLVDFTNIRRTLLARLLFKDRVWGRELGVPGFEGISFKFYRDRIGLHGRSSAPTVRVNNQPLVGQTTIQDQTWIGTHGRLYSFLTSPLDLQPEPGAADD